ncbi:hypothetical protein AVEN_69423-1 [Araneus ventricosus]|uniref:Uncharacterized protein n=1 Tax=Araneus ventricosus TaxID=182803 RepID=A0A4Y2KES8_ARAVE|nr:hypothetical protein AVEN_69423-1 [Araneus ventricosus]
MIMGYEEIGCLSVQPGRGRETISADVEEEIGVQVEEDKAYNFLASTDIRGKFSANVCRFRNRYCITLETIIRGKWGKTGVGPKFLRPVGAKIFDAEHVKFY